MNSDISLITTAKECDILIEKSQKKINALNSKKTILQLKLDISGADNSELIEEIAEIRAKHDALTAELASMEEGDKKSDMKILQTRVSLRLQLLEKQMANNGPVAMIIKQHRLRVMQRTIDFYTEFIEEVMLRKNEITGG